MDLEENLNQFQLLGKQLTKWTTYGDGFLLDGTYISWDSQSQPDCPWEKIVGGAYDELLTSRNTSLAVFNSLGISVEIKEPVNLCNLTVYSTNNEYLYIIPNNHPLPKTLQPLSYVSWSSMILTAAQYVEANNHLIYKNLTALIN